MGQNNLHPNGTEYIGEHLNWQDLAEGKQMEREREREEATKERELPTGERGDPTEDQGPSNLTFGATKLSIKYTDSDICQLVIGANTEG